MDIIPNTDDICLFLYIINTLWVKLPTKLQTSNLFYVLGTGLSSGVNIWFCNLSSPQGCQIVFILALPPSVLIRFCNLGSHLDCHMTLLSGPSGVVICYCQLGCYLVLSSGVIIWHQVLSSGIVIWFCHLASSSSVVI
jgi:hypothetical protein